MQQLPYSGQSLLLNFRKRIRKDTRGILTNLLIEGLEDSWGPPQPRPLGQIAPIIKKLYPLLRNSHLLPNMIRKKTPYSRMIKKSRLKCYKKKYDSLSSCFVMSYPDYYKHNELISLHSLKDCSTFLKDIIFLILIHSI